MGAAGAAVGVQALGAGFGIFKAAEEGKIHRQNASIYESNIPYIRARAAEQARQLQVGSYLTVGAQKAGYAGRGLAVAGSVFDVMSDTVKNFNRDTSFVLLEGELLARGEQRKADMARFQAKTGMRDAVIGGVLSTAGVAARTQMPAFGGGYTQNPYQMSPVNSGFAGTGYR